MPVTLHSHSDDEGDEARIEIIPLIDIMFFLLAAFMLVSLSMTHMRRVPIDLVKSSVSIAETKTPPVMIAIDANGIITWEHQIMTPSEITQRIHAMGVLPDLRATVAADQEARHKSVMAVITALREAGIEQVSFETKN
jgi:biopolymer transport protein ExbD